MRSAAFLPGFCARNILLAGMLCSGLLLAAEWWEKKPYTEWSEREVNQMLSDSPWGKVHSVTIVNPTATGRRTFDSVGTGDLEREKRNLFHMRFVTAMPVRMALGRQVMLARAAGADTSDIERFVQRSNAEHIIILLTVSAVPEGSSSARGYWTALMKLSTPDLVSNTFLATRTGKRVYLERYEPPGKDGLGAKYYFPRRMEDGTSFALESDREVRFETAITLVESGRSSGSPGTDEYLRTERVWMQFDLRKMVFAGRLEI